MTLRSAGTLPCELLRKWQLNAGAQTTMSKKWSWLRKGLRLIPYCSSTLLYPTVQSCAVYMVGCSWACSHSSILKYSVMMYNCSSNIATFSASAVQLRQAMSNADARRALGAFRRTRGNCPTRCQECRSVRYSKTCRVVLSVLTACTFGSARSSPNTKIFLLLSTC